MILSSPSRLTSNRILPNAVRVFGVTPIAGQVKDRIGLRLLSRSREQKTSNQQDEEHTQCPGPFGVVADAHGLAQRQRLTAPARRSVPARTRDAREDAERRGWAVRCARARDSLPRALPAHCPRAG